jgi:6-pyruvoyltetrahydropterin/6-carboxytetrahydropterin synthase
MKVFKRFSFDSAHRLPDWPDVHGHTYRAEVWFEGPVRDGYVIRESELSQLVDGVRRRLDHRYLNDFIDPPTSENIAKFVWALLMPTKMLTKVLIYRDSCDFGVEYEGDEEAVQGAFAAAAE